MSLKPTIDRVLVKVHENADTSESGIYVGQATTTFVNGRDKSKQQTVGEVVAIGDGRYSSRGVRRPPECDIGDFVCFSDTCGRYIDDEHLMIKEADIAFILDKAETVELVYELPEYYKR